MTKKLIQIVGGGQMGCGIAQICLLAGYTVHLVDLSEKQRQKAQELLSKKLSSDHLSTLSMSEALLTTPTFMIIEAIVEDLEIKKRFWSALPALPQTILASNTSSYSITELASFTSTPSQFIGIHFMNPVSKMSLVEVIRGIQTTDEIYAQTLDFVKILDKVAISVKDRPGFVVNRLLIPMINEAIFILDQGIACAEHIDTAMTLGAHHPLGPLALADLIGLDTCLAILKDLHSRLGEDKYRPCPLLYNYVHAGYLGRKSGRGFYFYH